MEITKFSRKKTTKVKDVYDVDVKMTMLELFKLIPENNNEGGNNIVNATLGLLNKSLKKEHGNYWYDNWEIRNEKEEINFLLKLNIYKD